MCVTGVHVYMIIDIHICACTYAIVLACVWCVVGVYVSVLEEEAKASQAALSRG